MGLILPQEIEVELVGSTISHYENLGYTIPRVYKNYKWTVPKGTYLKVSVSDLSKASNEYVEAKCDCCGTVKKIMYSQYNQNVKKNGVFLCTNNSEHKDFIKGIDIELIRNQIKCFYNKYQRFPLYSEYTKEYGFDLTYKKILKILKRNHTTLQDELAQIDCMSLNKTNPQYYDKYLEKLKEIIKNNPNIGNNLYAINSGDVNYNIPDIRWFITYCPDKNVHNIDSFKKWAGLYSKHMSKDDCVKIILQMSNDLKRPLLYDDFRGHNYGQVTISMINKYWGSLNKMKKDLGLEVLQESMIDKHLSKEQFDKAIIDICNYIINDNRNYITTREIDSNQDWSASSSLRKYAKEYYNQSLTELFESKGIHLGKKGRGMTYTFEDGERTTSQFEYLFSKYLRGYGLQYNKDYFRDVKYSDFIPDCNNNMNCDYVVYFNNKIIYIEIAGLIESYKLWYYNDKIITASKTKEKYRIKLKKKESMLQTHGLIYFILFPCDLTKDNLIKILNNNDNTTRSNIQNFMQNNIDWVNVRENEELDYSKPFLRDTKQQKSIT